MKSKHIKHILLFILLGVWPTKHLLSSVLVIEPASSNPEFINIEFNRSEDVWGVYELGPISFKENTTKSLTVALFQNKEFQIISSDPHKKDGISDVMVESFSYTISDKKDKITFNLEGAERERFKQLILADHVSRTNDSSLRNLKITNESIECDRSFKTIKCSLQLQ